ncbi:hypothetical protein [Scrofimicrobium sp. R131]|uniref:Uncharacterized protein n=1 Tax=Scrofimicrobium appendicitidis TaxID=3079930 RepID=A0AAU7V5X3_9ACTO
MSRLLVQRAFGLGVVSLFALALGACSSVSGAGGAASGGGVQILVEKDVDSWAMPSNAYYPPDISLEYYAVDLKAEPCLEEAGINFRMTRYDPNGARPVTENAAGDRIFNQKIAAEYGYHEQLDPRTNWEDAKRNHFDTELNDKQVWEKWSACEDQATRELGGDPEMIGYSYRFPIDSVDRDPAVLEAEARWRDCMAPLGIPDLGPDAAPLRTPVPTNSQVEKWGWPNDIAPWDIPPASADEIEAAVFDAKCRDSSGWSQARYDAEWDAEVAYLTKHYKELEAKRVKYEAITEAYLNEIREHGE